MYQKVSEQDAQTWWDKNFSKWKTQDWLNKNDFRQALEINITTAEDIKLDQIGGNALAFTEKPLPTDANTIRKKQDSDRMWGELAL